MGNKIATNNQSMETHFKKELNDKWALLQEFKVYKENFNTKYDIPHESIAGHFCETQESFSREAAERYERAVIHTEAVKPDFIIAEEYQNGHAKELKPTII
jgi:hypothetical protein